MYSSPQEPPATCTSWTGKKSDCKTMKETFQPRRWPQSDTRGIAAYLCNQLYMMYVCMHQIFKSWSGFQHLAEWFQCPLLWSFVIKRILKSSSLIFCYQILIIIHWLKNFQHKMLITSNLHDLNFFLRNKNTFYFISFPKTERPQVIRESLIRKWHHIILQWHALHNSRHSLVYRFNTITHGKFINNFLSRLFKVHFPSIILKKRHKWL